VKKEKDKQPEIVFQIEQFAFTEQYLQTELPEGPFNQRKGIFGNPANQGHVITGAGQGSANPYHTLIIIEIIGHGTKDLFWHKGANISYLWEYKQ